MLSYHRIFLVILLFLLPFSSYAAAPSRSGLEGCVDKQGKRVPTKYDANLAVFAEARRIPHSGKADTYVIHINPERYYLGRDTQKWLYQRQCFHILEEHPIINPEIKRVDIKHEEKVDCLATKKLYTDTELKSNKRKLYSIQRDIDRLMEKRRWNEIFAGPQRRINLSSCKLGSSKKSKY